MPCMPLGSKIIEALDSDHNVILCDLIDMTAMHTRRNELIAAKVPETDEEFIEMSMPVEGYLDEGNAVVSVVNMRMRLGLDDYLNKPEVISSILAEIGVELGEGGAIPELTRKQSRQVAGAIADKLKAENLVDLDAFAVASEMGRSESEEYNRDPAKNYDLGKLNHSSGGGNIGRG